MCMHCLQPCLSIEINQSNNNHTPTTRSRFATWRLGTTSTVSSRSTKTIPMTAGLLTISCPTVVRWKTSSSSTDCWDWRVSSQVCDALLRPAKRITYGTDSLRLPSYEAVPPAIERRPPHTSSGDRLFPAGYSPQASLDLLHLERLPRTQRICDPVFAAMPPAGEVQTVY